MTVDDDTNRRLVSIETKVDRIQEVLISMARIEERQVSFDDFSKMIMVRCDKCRMRMDEIERAVSNNTKLASFATKTWWILFAALAAATTNGLWGLMP